MILTGFKNRHSVRDRADNPIISVMPTTDWQDFLPYLRGQYRHVQGVSLKLYWLTYDGLSAPEVLGCLINNPWPSLFTQNHKEADMAQDFTQNNHNYNENNEFDHEAHALRLADIGDLIEILDELVVDDAGINKIDLMIRLIAREVREIRTEFWELLQAELSREAVGI